MLRNLASLNLRTRAQVTAVTPPAHAPEWADWLAEIGFIPGETVEITAFAKPGNDPLVVRIGMSSFAMRVAEAQCITVKLVE